MKKYNSNNNSQLNITQRSAHTLQNFEWKNSAFHYSFLYIFTISIAPLHFVCFVIYNYNDTKLGGGLVVHIMVLVQVFVVVVIFVFLLLLLLLMGME